MIEKRRHFVKRLILGIPTFIVIFLIFSMGITDLLFKKYFGRNDIKSDDIALTYDDVDPKTYPRKLVNFKSGENTLQGYVYGEENTKGLIVIAHGIFGGADSYLGETMYFVDKGWRVFSFDGTGTRKSEGKGIRGLPQTKLDLDAALTYIEQSQDLMNLPIMLYGHSMGGYAATAILKSNHKICAVVCLSGFNSPIDALYAKMKSAVGFYANIEYPFIWLYQTMIFGKDASITAVDGINASNIPIMIIYGLADDFVPYDSIGIYAYRQQITNPKIIFVPCGKEFRNGHDNMQLSVSAGQYAAQKREELSSLHEQYGDKIPEEVFRDFYISVDKKKMNELDLEFMSSIVNFFESSIISQWKVEEMG